MTACRKERSEKAAWLEALRIATLCLLSACNETPVVSLSSDAGLDASLNPPVDASTDAATLRDAAAAATSDALAASDASDGSNPIPPDYRDGGPCPRGSTRCHGLMGYQECLDDGGWGESHSCAGYSTNGTASYCAVVTPTGGEPWAACVEPACWYWIGRGLLGETESSETEVGVCVDGTRLSRCRADGTLGPAHECVGICESAGSLNGRTLGFCAAQCVDGAEECIAGPLYRKCIDSRWSTEPESCPNGALCQPSTMGNPSRVVCGGPCESGTSRCAAEGNIVETCIDGEWQPAPACALGRCIEHGPQAQCEAECMPGERSCAFDGAPSVRQCGEAGLWEDETPCAEEERCRIAGTHALGCVSCVGPTWLGGNGYAVADSRCQGDSIQACSMDDTWGTLSPCDAEKRCVEIQQGPSSVAFCE